jgi:hypothetical protein
MSRGQVLSKPGVVAQRVRKLNGVTVTSVLYNGLACGHGKYFTGMIDGKLIEDENGKPLPIKQIGVLE